MQLHRTEQHVCVAEVTPTHFQTQTAPHSAMPSHHPRHRLSCGVSEGTFTILSTGTRIELQVTKQDIEENYVAN